MNGDLAKLVQMMQSGGLAEQLGNFSNNSNSATQNQANGNAGQVNIDPALFASFFANQGNTPPAQNPNLMNLFQSAVSGGQNPMGAMGALNNPNTMSALMRAMQNMNMPSGTQQTQWQSQYNRAKPNIMNQQPTSAESEPQVSNPFRQRQDQMFTPNVYGEVNGKDFPEDWEDTISKSGGSHFNSHHTPQNFKNNTPVDFAADGKNQQPAKTNTPPGAQGEKSGAASSGDNSAKEKKQPQGEAPSAQTPPQFDVNTLNGENLDEFTRLFENFLEKENIDTSPLPPNGNGQPFSSSQNGNPPHGEYTGGQNNENRTNSGGGSPFGNMDMGSLFSMLQNMGAGNNRQNTAGGGENTQNGKNSGGNNPFGNMDMGSMMGLLGAFGQGNQDDDKARLLLALKPFLSPGRIQKVDSALQFIQLFKILPMFGQMT